MSHAAWNGRDTVQPNDVDVVEPLVLAHRRNETAPTPPSPPPFSRPPTERLDNKPKQQAHQQQSEASEHKPSSSGGPQ